jgi:hypothetical protein
MNLPNLKMDSTASDAQFMMSGFPLDPTGPMAAMTPALGEADRVFVCFNPGSFVGGKWRIG